MQREQVTQGRIGRIITSSLCAISLGILFPACGSSGSGTTAPGAGGTTGNVLAIAMYGFIYVIETISSYRIDPLDTCIN